ncbi:GNAT family N-acetyltransferase [Candidatus Aeolococcus gillhamiae]
MENPPSARRAAPAEVDLVATIFGLALAQDPLWSRALRTLPLEQRAPLWHLFVEGGIRHSWTWLADGGAAASVWIPPGETELGPEQEAQVDEFALQLGPGEADFRELLSRFDAAHPHAEPHYYLSLLGTHPEHRGRGTGMWLLAHDLALIDAEHHAAYLESSNPRNDARYRSVGFEPVGEFSYPGNGPVVTTMWRLPR